MQASSAWSPPTGTLGRIVDEARERARALESRIAELEERVKGVSQIPAFASALRGMTVSVIAEVKRRSPSKGWIQPALNAANQAGAYTTGASIGSRSSGFEPCTSSMRNDRADGVVGVESAEAFSQSDSPSLAFKPAFATRRRR